MAGVESRAFYSVTAIFLRPSPSHPNPRKKEMTLRQITGVYLPRKGKCRVSILLLLLLLLLILLLPLFSSSAAVLCLYHGTRGQQCDQGAFQKTNSRPTYQHVTQL